MSRKPIEVELRGLMTPRERVWNAVMKHPKEGKPFTKTTLQDHCNPMVLWTVVDDYLECLEAGGYIRRVAGKGVAPGQWGEPIQYVRVKSSADAPRLGKDGKPVMQGMGTLAMWRAMKVLKTFDYKSIAQAATMEPLVVKPEAAKSYVNALARAGYLAQVKASKPGVPAVYRLAKNTGPHAPCITKRKTVFDRNTGSFAELETAQEVCDGIDA